MLVLISESCINEKYPAIGICFSMTDVFRSEILAVVMQQIVDEPVLPVLFLRTVSHLSNLSIGQYNDFS